MHIGSPHLSESANRQGPSFLVKDLDRFRCATTGVSFTELFSDSCKER